MTATAAPAVGLPPTPFVGLTPFREADAAFFFGRERERRLLAASILSSRLTILYGASGVGKSSLLRAGLVPDFRARAAETVGRGLVPESVLVVCSAWRDDPVQAVADATETAIRAQLGPVAPDAPRPTPRLDDLLLDWTRRLDDRAAELAADGDETQRSELLLVLDQFEEYFLYHPDEDGEGTLAVELPRAVMREDLRASFLIAIREDAYTQLDRFEGRIRNLFASNFRLEHLDERAARRAIEGPVERYNELLAAGEEPYAVEPELVPAILDQVRAGSISLGQAGAGTVETDGRGELRVETPFLQLVLTRLWEEEQRAASRTLRLATLERLGGAERLVRTHLDEALGELPKRDRDLVASVFHQLVTPSGTKIVHAVPDLAEYAHVREQELGPVLDALAAKRILRPVDPAPGATARRFEIFHDVLAPAILDWRAWHERRAATARQRRARRRLAAVAVGLLAIAVVLAGLAVWALDQRRDARRAADAAARQELIARSQALAASAISQIDADPELGLLLALEASDAAPTPEATNALRRALIASRVRAAIPGATRSIDLSPSGARVVTVAARDGAVRVWRAAGGGAVTPPFAAGARSAAFDRTGRVVVTAGRDGYVRVFDAETGRRRIEIRSGSPSLVAARFSRDGRRILAVGASGARVFDARNGKPGASLRVRPVEAVHFGPRGETVLLVAPAGRSRVWRWQAGEAARAIAAPRDAFGGPVAVADDARVALLGGFGFLLGQRLELLDQALWVAEPRARRLRRLTIPAGTSAVAFAPGGRLLGTAGSETGRVWDARTGKQVSVLRGHVAALTHITFSRDGETVVTGSEDGSVRLWRTETGEPLAVLQGPVGPIRAVAGPRGDAIATAGGDAVRVWALDAVPTRFARRAPDVFENPPITQIVFGRDGSHLVAVGESGASTLEIPSGKLLQRFDPTFSTPGHIDAVSPDGALVAYDPGVRDARSGRLLLRRQLFDAAFSGDGARMAFVDFENRVGIWTRRSREVRILGRDRDAYEVGFGLGGTVVALGDETRRAWRGSGQPVRARVADGPYAAVSPSRDDVVPDLAARIDARVVRLYSEGEEKGRLAGHAAAVTDVAFAPDRPVIATASEDGTARIWEYDPFFRPGSGRIGADVTLRGHAGAVHSVAFSPDGTLTATAGADGTVRVWEAETGASVVVIGAGGRPADVAEFSPDGRFIAAGGEDRVIRLYDCEPCRPLDELLALARTRVTRELTPQERRQFLG